MTSSLVWNRLASAAVVPPTFVGVQAVGRALIGMALCTGGATSLGWTQRFVAVPYGKDSWWRRRRRQAQHEPKVDENCQEGGLNAGKTSLPLTFCRTLVVPGLVEEVVWRVVLQPPGTSWPVMLAVNAAFAAYHVVGSATAEWYLDGQRQGARAVLADPAFLTLAMVLGNLCSYAYVQAGHALWAPVLVHAATVTVWLDCLGGQRALSTPGGLPLAPTRTATATTTIHRKAATAKNDNQ